MDPSMENHLEVYFSPEDLAEMGVSKEMLVAMGFSQNDSGTCSTMAAHSNVSVSIPPVVSLSSQEMQVDTTAFVGEPRRKKALVPLVDQRSNLRVSVESETLAAQSTVSVSVSEPSTTMPLFNEEMHKYSQKFLVELPGNGALVPLDDKTIKHTVDVIAGTMIGLAKYLEMERADSGLREVLLSSLPKRLKDLQEKGKKDIENTLPLLETLLQNRKEIEQELQEIGETPALLKKRKDNQENFDNELDKIYFPLSLKLKKTTDDFLPGLLSNLPESLKDIKEKNDFVVTLEEVKNEASKWIYFHMKGQNQKVGAHPQHIKNIPGYIHDCTLEFRKTKGVWRNEHPGCKKNCNPPCRKCERTCYPSEPAYLSIASYTGLEIDQVLSLFTNDRKRRAGKDPVVRNNQLKKHFHEEKTDKLRVWKAKNPGEKLDESSLKELMDATGMDQKQIRNWFGNNAPGRENRNLSSKSSRSKT